MKSFITGSRMYGTPSQDADTDLVVLVHPDECSILIAQAEANNGGLNPSGHPDDVSLRFGNLNLIVLTDPQKFDLWKKATDTLFVRRPVTRQEAVDYHRAHVDAVIAMHRQMERDADDERICRI